LQTGDFESGLANFRRAADACSPSASPDGESLAGESSLAPAARPPTALPLGCPLPWVSAGRAYLQMNEPARAEAHLQAALKLDPRCAAAHLDLGQVIGVARRGACACACVWRAGTFASVAGMLISFSPLTFLFSLYAPPPCFFWFVVVAFLSWPAPAAGRGLARGAGALRRRARAQPVLSRTPRRPRLRACSHRAPESYSPLGGVISGRSPLRPLA